MIRFFSRTCYLPTPINPSLLPHPSYPIPSYLIYLCHHTHSELVEDMSIGIGNLLSAALLLMCRGLKGVRLLGMAHARLPPSLLLQPPSLLLQVQGQNHNNGQNNQQVATNHNNKTNHNTSNNNNINTTTTHNNNNNNINSNNNNNNINNKPPPVPSLPLTDAQTLNNVVEKCGKLTVTPYLSYTPYLSLLNYALSLSTLPSSFPVSLTFSPPSFPPRCGGGN